MTEYVLGLFYPVCKTRIQNNGNMAKVCFLGFCTREIGYTSRGPCAIIKPRQMPKDEFSSESVTQRI